MPCRAARLVAAVTLAVALVSACSGDDKIATPKTTTTTAKPATTTTTEPVSAVQVAVTTADLLAGQPGPVPMPEPVRAATAALVDRWVRASSVVPLESGAVDPGMELLVSDAVKARLAGPDRAVLVDEGLPLAKPVVADRAEVALTGLAGPGDTVGVVVATITVDLRTDGPETPAVRVQRTGDLVLAPAGDGWLIDGYSLLVTRDVGPTTETTSATTEDGSG